MPDFTTYDTCTVALRLKGEAQFEHDRIRRKLAAPNAASITQLAHEVLDRADENARQVALAGLKEFVQHEILVAEVPQTAKAAVADAYDADTQEALALLATYARAEVDAGLQSPGSQLSQLLGAAALRPSGERLRRFVAAVAEQSAALMRHGLAKFEDFPTQRASFRAAESPTTAFPTGYGDFLRQRMESMVTAAEAGASRLSYDGAIDAAITRIVTASGHEDAGSTLPYAPEAAPQDVVRKILAYPEAESLFEYGQSYSREETFIARTVRSLNQKSEALQAELEHEVEDMVEPLYPGVQVRANLRFQKGSLEIIATLMLTWAGGILINTTKEYFEGQLTTIAHQALDRVWSRFAALVGLSDYISPTDTQVKSVESRPLRERVASPVVPQAARAAGPEPGGTGSLPPAVDEAFQRMWRRDALMLLLLGLILLFIILLLASQYYTVVIQPRP